jgi:hypothetical protein
MRKAVLLFLLLSTAGCGRGENDTQRSSEDLRTFDVQEEPSSAADASRDAPPPPTASPRPPGITPTAAPGVAFNYLYAFRLPPRRISEVQEQHAQACEKLGIDKCRITGMRYELTGREDVSAQLAFKLDPALARRFGKDGIDAVLKADGLLTQAQITGEDVGSRIEEGQRSQADLQEELRRVEQQLARPGLSARERVELQQQAERLRSSLRVGAEAQTGRRQQLATTPMVFNYQAGDTDESLRAALGRAVEAFLSSLGALLVFFVYILPWLLLALAGFVAWRWARRRFLIGRDPQPVAVEPITPTEA